MMLHSQVMGVAALMLAALEKQQNAFLLQPALNVFACRMCPSECKSVRDARSCDTQDGFVCVSCL